tara:strand:+ start:8459 stop:8635 length:177 start_codon:yes stop_codon:yes gene_type:complete
MKDLIRNLLIGGVLLALLQSCATQCVTQRQLLIQKEIDMLQADYYYQIDSLYIEYYKE